MGGEREPALDWRERAGLPWLEARGEGWRAAFSTRAGGVSPPPYDSLNIGFSVADDPSNVRRNRVALAGALDLPAGDFVVPGQVHGTIVADVGETERGRGAGGPGEVIAATDGLITATPALPLMVSFADCVPVLLVARSPEGTVAIALVHAGWRGMLAGIVTTAAQRLRRRGALCAAVVGPSIGPCCFSVAADVGEAFAAAFGDDVARDGAVDLWSIAAQQLSDYALTGEQVRQTRLCTSCDPRFFSHRRDKGLTGRQAAIAWVTGIDGGVM